MKLDDFSKIYNGGTSIAKVYGGERAGLGSRLIAIDSQRIDKITASSTYGGTSVDMLFDGIIGNDNNRWVSTENDTQPKLTITLDEPYGISQIIIHNGLGGSYFVEEVEVIVDGINQGTFIGGESPIGIGLVNMPMGKVIELKFPAGHNRIYEIEIYGKERSNLIYPKEHDVYLAQDSDFVRVGTFSTYQVYRGEELEIEIPTHINGNLVTSTQYMFAGGTVLYTTYNATPVTKVVLKHSNVTNMSNMFRNSKAIILDLSNFDASNVTNTSNMFQNASATVGYARTQADADKFNASSNKPAGLNFVVKYGDFVKVNNFWVYRGTALEVGIPTHINGELVTSTQYMFSGMPIYGATPVTKVVLNHSNPIYAANMFSGSKATILDLSSFDASNVTNTTSMFQNSLATTGYARTQADADKFNASSNKPTGLNFVVKP